MTTHLGLQRILLPTAQVSSLTTGSITLPSARGAFTPPGDFDSIATVTVGSGGTAQVDLDSIPQTYKHLQIRLLSRNSDTGSFNNSYVRFNSSSSTIYDEHLYYSNGSTVAGSYATGLAQFNNGIISASNSLSAGIFAPAIIEILDYASTNKHKIVRTVMGGMRASASGNLVYMYSGAWRSTDAITSINFHTQTDTVSQHSTFALYGIKG